MKNLYKTGLSMMLLPFVFLISFSVTHGLNEYYDLASNLQVALIQGVPCLFVAAISWLWPRRGGVVTIALSLLLLTLSATALMTSKVPPPGQKYPDLSLIEVSIYILPYTVLFLGSILALISALVRKAHSPDWLPRLSAGAAGVNKLRITGLLMMLSLGVVYILLFIIAIGIAGDSVPAANLFMGLTLGLTFATPLLLIIIAAWRWPCWGSTVVGGLSLTALTLLVVRLIYADSSFPPLMLILFIFTASIVLTASILVFISVKRAGDSDS